MELSQFLFYIPLLWAHKAFSYIAFNSGLSLVSTLMCACLDRCQVGLSAIKGETRFSTTEVASTDTGAGAAVFTCRLFFCSTWAGQCENWGLSRHMESVGFLFCWLAWLLSWAATQEEARELKNLGSDWMTRPSSNPSHKTCFWEIVVSLFSFFSCTWGYFFAQIACVGLERNNNLILHANSHSPTPKSFIFLSKLLSYYYTLQCTRNIR